jgi:hypothetical protein
VSVKAVGDFSPTFRQKEPSTVLLLVGLRLLFGLTKSLLAQRLRKNDHHEEPTTTRFFEIVGGFGCWPDPYAQAC